MDTIFATKNQIYFRQRTNICAVGFLFFALFLHSVYFVPSLLANDLLANGNISIPKIIKYSQEFDEPNLTLLKNEFDSRVREKYRGYDVKNISDGVKHVQMVRYFNGKPVRLNIVEVNKIVASDYEVRPAIASTTLQNKRSLRNIAQNSNSIVAINGGFFKPQSGVPLGTLMINKKLYTGPIYNRVALGIFEDGYDVGRVQFDGKILGNGHEIKIHNINQPRMLSSYTLVYTRDWGSYAPASPQYGVQLRVEGNKITAASANPLSIPENGFVIVGPKSELSKLFGAKYVETKISLNPKWDNVQHIISGGPYLVKNNQVFVDVAEQKLLSIGGRNPRTAIGYTKDNDLILVTADGREGSSVGLTLTELAYFMKSLGCINAINLDGGGSTVMYVNGVITNHPQQPGGIGLSNALVISKKNF